MEYGKALLRKAQAADDPFGSKVPKETPVGVNPARPVEKDCVGDHCVRGDCGKMVEPKESSGMEGVNCKDGLLIPIWPHHENMSAGDRLGRGLLYIILMVYLFDVRVHSDLLNARTMFSCIHVVDSEVHFAESHSI